MLAYIITHTEEGSLGLVAFQGSQYPGSEIRDRAIIEGEENILLLSLRGLSVFVPDETGVEVFEHRWGFEKIHA